VAKHSTPPLPAGAEGFTRLSRLEHFPIKWTPVDRRKCDESKNLERKI
jgi:hypothetical protein